MDKPSPRRPWLRPLLWVLGIFAGAGSLIVHHEQEGPEPQEFKTLKVLVWMPTEQKILRLDFPRWSVLPSQPKLGLGNA